MAIYEKPTRELLNDWAREHLVSGKSFSRSELLAWFKEHYPGIKDKTVRAHIRAMSTNSPSRVHHPVRPGSGHDLLFQLGPNEFRLYESETDPDPIYRGTEERSTGGSISGTGQVLDQEEGGQSESGEFALEKHLQEYLVRNLHQIEAGLSPYFDELNECLEVPAGGRRIDILARDKTERAVVLELKVSKGYDRVIGQLLRYMGWVKRNLEEGESVRGIIVASEISEDLKLAVSELPSVSLYEYGISFSISSVGLE